jgi:hypothetical protein
MFAGDAPAGEGTFAAEAGQPVAYAPEVGVAALADYVREHNRQALIFALFALGAAVLAWVFAVVFIYWMALLIATLSRSFNPDTLLEITRRDLLGPHVPLWFALGAAFWLGVGWMVRRYTRIAKLREERHYFLWVAAEVFMALPNVTFAVPGNLRAITQLTGTDASLAWRLMQRIEENGGRLNVANLRQETEDERALGRIVFRLQLIGLLSTRELEDGWYLHLEHREQFSEVLAQAASDFRPVADGMPATEEG